ncbi:Na(+)-translocating NADH-quinone reductase subunit F [Gilvibacter sp.]|uniref:Na(+)-translocating NADH-quinone reductase subunit F n=1 Tax=Gilvibacter sp. TaxID=2729997 RepID=UPI003F49CDD4
MQTPTRFDKALNALYEGFYNGQLHPEDSCRCAVGTLCNGWSAWKHFSDQHGSLDLNYVGKVHEGIGRRYCGYQPSELLRIEAAFLKGCGYDLPLDHRSKRPQDPADPKVIYQGLLAAISELCRLDRIPEFLPHKNALEDIYRKRQLQTA